MAARAAQAVPAPLPEPEKPKRELPADPAEREKALAEGRPLASMILAILNVAAVRLPPHRPFSLEEKTAIQDPLEQVIWKYSVDVGPEWALALAIGSVGFMRYIEVNPAILAKLGIALPAPDAQPAAAATVEVKS